MDSRYLIILADRYYRNLAGLDDQPRHRPMEPFCGNNPVEPPWKVNPVLFQTLIEKIRTETPEVATAFAKATIHHHLDDQDLVDMVYGAYLTNINIPTRDLAYGLKEIQRYQARLSFELNLCLSIEDDVKTLRSSLEKGRILPGEIFTSLRKIQGAIQRTYPMIRLDEGFRRDLKTLYSDLTMASRTLESYLDTIFEDRAVAH